MTGEAATADPGFTVQKRHPREPKYRAPVHSFAYTPGPALTLSQLHFGIDSTQPNSAYVQCRFHLLPQPVAATPHSSLRPL